MPTYEYVCRKCGHEFEVFQSIADEPLSVCPKECCARKKWGKGAVQRKIGAGAGLIFKGNGFYITDHRSEGYKTAAKKDSAAPAATGEKTAPKEAKTAGKNSKPGASPSKS